MTKTVSSPCCTEPRACALSGLSGATLRVILAFSCTLPMSFGFAAPHVPFHSSRALDQQIEATLETLTSGDLERARVLARQLAWRFPQFALGQLLSAELESSAALKDVMVSPAEPISTPLMKLLLEAQARMASRTATTSRNRPLPTSPPAALAADEEPPHPSRSISIANARELPDEIVQLGAEVSNLILVDLQQSTLMHVVGQRDTHSVVSQHYVGSGKAGFGKDVEGDNKTPLGIYTITGLRSDASLPDLYGSGALMLDYPNALDRYEGRTGSGIWLHGVPHNQRSRAPRSSEGCVTMSNDHLISLRDQITVSDTLVFLGHRFNWSTKESRHQRRAAFRQLFVRFQQAWAKQDLAALASLYEQPETLWQRVEKTQSHLMKVSADPADLRSTTASRPGALTEFSTEPSTERLTSTGTQTQLDDGNLTASPSSAESNAPASDAIQRPTPMILMELADVDASELSILMNPTLPEPFASQSREYLVMRARFGAMNEHEITLYWGRSGDSEEGAQWQIVAEHWQGRDS